MTLKKHPFLYGLLVVLLIAFGITYSWTYTPHGRLDYRAAFSLHLLSFEINYKPDPDIDFEFKLPVNLIYGLSGTLPKETVSKTEDITIPGDGVDIPARIYWPASTELSSADTPLPIMVYYHGGGFVVGSVDIFDPLARQLSNVAHAIVISVDYRLAPKYPYPAAVEDGYAALQWAAQHAAELNGDANRIIVAGDSAGGNLAAVTAQKARDENGPAIHAQILYYPATDLTDTHYPSKELFIDGYGLSTSARNAFDTAYLGHVTDKTDPYVSPLYAAHLSSLPPALIVTAGFDPLRDDGQTYAKRLQSEGTVTTLKNYPTMIHGFMSIGLFSQQREALNATREFLDQVVKL
ncbi:alpha/beta hydrolase [Aestuariicella hydrocarbonica]|uniref:Alpha/beta hydrolase n=1 Tax=Pseudomaricurvus hydrocarbonicus TaxID=1470433 RepID=A0A9E5JT35_9GAMM|nr:alpha/beta hydrolase [Aestuariicella hydrocarbonica]NHO66029.1 alpha/beta hydrolase [Aestuariicella hydrocarbonica]